MALTSSSRASRALIFMQHSRKPNFQRPSVQQHRYDSSSTASSSRYDPSNFAPPRGGSHRFPSISPNPTRSPPPSGPKPSPHPSTPPSSSHLRSTLSSSSTTADTISSILTATTPPKPSLLTRFFTSLGLYRPPHKPPPGYIPAPFNGKTNPYRAHKTWPPQFSALHPKEQFHFEKTYRRRAKLAYARPQWNKRIKLLQHTLIVTTLIYFIFIAEPRDMGTPWDGFRVWFYGKMAEMTSLPESARLEAARMRQDALVLKEQRARSPMSWEKVDAEKNGASPVNESVDVGGERRMLEQG